MGISAGIAFNLIISKGNIRFIKADGCKKI